MKTKLSLTGLINLLATAENNAIVTFLIETEVKLNKTGKDDKGEKIVNPYLENSITKEVLLKGEVKYNYMYEVNVQRINEGKQADFIPQQRVWGEKEGCFVSHKGELYIDMKVIDAGIPQYKNNGTNCDKVLFDAFITPKKESSRQEIENKVIVRTVKLASIKEVSLNNKEYSLV